MNRYDLLVCLFCGMGSVWAQRAETLAPLRSGAVPSDLNQLWKGFDPRAEPLDVEILREWEENEVVLRVIRFRIGVFKGRTARLAAVYGFPKQAASSNKRLPGLLQIHGGGQYADYRACLANAERGYATLSIAWAGRIMAPGHAVTPKEVKLFWENKTEHPGYRLTTDWGPLDAYHAPARNPGNAFPSIRPAAWTLDPVKSPRNSGWFLCALAARRGLTFLEQQKEVDAQRLGVYGHSMGGKLTVLTAIDPRVRAAAPSCGGISDRDNTEELYRKTLGDDVSLKQIRCPVIFLSPANDFHGRIGDLAVAVRELAAKDWRVTCSPHHNHQDTPEYEVGTLLWFDHHLKRSFVFPNTPQASIRLDAPDGVPVLSVRPDRPGDVVSVDVFYTQQGRPHETAADREQTMHRHWHHSRVTRSRDTWTAAVPLIATDRPLWVFANVTYPLRPPVSGAGYYYRTYTASSFNVSSLLKIVTPTELVASGVKTTMQRSNLIESFGTDWQKEWFSYRPTGWARTTHKLGAGKWQAPAKAKLALDVSAASANMLVVRLDTHAAEVSLAGKPDWQTVVLPSRRLSRRGRSLFNRLVRHPAVVSESG